MKDDCRITNGIATMICLIFVGMLMFGAVVQVIYVITHLNEIIWEHLISFLAFIITILAISILIQALKDIYKTKK